MKASILRLCLLGLTAAFLAGFNNPLVAQTTTTATTTNKSQVAAKPTTPASAEKTAKSGPFHGKLAALDKIGKTIVVGKRTFKITSETKIKKSGKPATLEDGVVGETVSGYVKPGADGKLMATTVNFGPKPAENSVKQTPAGPKESQPK